MPSHPTLVAVWRRLERAKQRLDAIFQMEGALAQANLNRSPRITLNRERYENERVASEVTVDPSTVVPAYHFSELQLTAGEYLYHLRASLDHIVYNLVWLDRGSPKADTKFPIARSPAEWPATEMRLHSWGLTDKHVEIIRQNQPFAWDGGWTGQLAELSNRDKHRAWLDAPRLHTVHFTLSPETVRPLPDDPSRLEVVPQQHRSAITLEDGSSLTTTCYQLLLDSLYFLEEVESEFGECTASSLRSYIRKGNPPTS